MTLTAFDEDERCRMFDEVKPEVNAFIEKNRRERDERRNARIKEKSAVIIQKNWRGYKDRTQVVAEFRRAFDSVVANGSSAVDLLEAFKYILFKFSPESDRQRFELLVRRIMSSIDTGNPEESFLFLAIRKSTVVKWITSSKWIITQIINYIRILDPCNPNESKVLNVYLSFLLVLTDYTRWNFYKENMHAPMHQLACVFLNHMLQNKLFERLHILLDKGLARHTPVFTSTSLTGIFTISMRPLIYKDFPQSSVIQFASEILAVPGFVLHINSMMNEAYDVILRERLCSKIVQAFYQNSDELMHLLSKLEGSYVLCFIANLIQLSLLEGEVLALYCTEFCVILSKLLSHLSSYVGNKKSNLSSWHPILGWFSQSLDNSLQAAMPFVTKQLRLLWNGRMVRLLFADLYAQEELGDSDSRRPSASTSSKVDTRPRSRLGPGAPTAAENLATAGLLPPLRRCAPHGARSFDLDRYTTRVRHGLSHFLHQLSGGGSSKQKSDRTRSPSSSSSAPSGRRNAPGPHDLPQSLKAVCMLYCFTVGSLREIRNDILAGLSLGDLLPRMWRLISRCGSALDWVPVLLDSKVGLHSEPHESHLMHIFGAAVSNLLSILDDVEAFELGKSFSIEELCEMGSFFNQLVYDTVLSVPDPWSLSNLGGGPNTSITKDGINPTSGAHSHPNPSGSTLPGLFTQCLRLLSVIYERDSRHPFTPPDFWLIPKLKISSFLSDLRKPKPHALFLLKNVPHIIPHKERVLLFRERVREDKASIGVQTRMNWLTDDGPVGAMITIHRSRLVEDGYQQLATLTSAQLRMKIRVQFVNEMGLDEVGIDLDGVFKEFLEETLHRVFDPSLNLFRVTSDQRLYPSPTSQVQENHLLLFEFLGKMLAKAVYEGIVVDVPFANFFLTQLLGREKAGCYSFLDELATLDRELYKSLSYIKHYDGDVADLEFTYSYAEDCLGQMVVHDLCPGGRYITVTNDLKISYVHRVAHFRMYEQIRPQTASFIRGFYSILNPDWLAMFSPPELQKLISGDSISVNIDDLRQNTRYSGGFHSNHRVIKWLWDILRRDFTDEERSLFLKFVTSCSRPPLLGFANLEPPFCIRCVHYANEDQDVGDTLGSVLKGFFGVGGRREEVARLPTTSTCFNLLKLPNYTSRTVLKEKLRYAINSHAGFELS